MSLADARTEAKRALAEKTLGKVKPKFLAYAEARDGYLKHVEGKNRASTYAGYKSRLSRIDWGRSNLADITPRDVLSKLKAFDEVPMEKRYAFVVLRSFFNWCVAEHHLDSSPMDKLSAPQKSDRRERVLTTDELNAIWNAATDDGFGHTVKVLMLTGQRRGEVQHITLEGDVANIPGAHTKNKRAHAFPVPVSASKLLSPAPKWVGWGKSKAALYKASKVANWTLHDLRRTYSTNLAALKVPPHIIEALLNHKTGVISGVAATYNRFLYLDEMRKAVAAYERWITPYLAAKVS
ncbi:tyrosine-type recombinase/integrase [Limobrevibacterium gyesilva]|uniref:Integrase n=1 Tax=Limobrevibacterium gyesilva TaxID=2991712 RepID=A0AA41YP02_9PROT|nr:hypothetical protein [Limobrevibacterium gyesilva]MCW3477054.1 hypothetical protein [Limobrevibacterium gyesilva]